MAMSADEVKRLVENVAAVSQQSAAAIEQVAASIRKWHRPAIRYPHLLKILQPRLKPSKIS